MKLLWLMLATPAFAISLREPMSLPCQKMCDEIRVCSEKAGREDLAEFMCYLARCETGDKCRKEIRSPSGRFQGVFQFTGRTWRGVCGPIFKKKKMKICQGKKTVYDPCCATICVAEILATNANGGIRNWPHCGKQARKAASEDGSKIPD